MDVPTAEHSGGGHLRISQRAAVALVLLTLGLIAACSGQSGGGKPAGVPPTPAVVTRTTPRVPGPAATLSPLTGGKGVFIGAGSPENLAAEGYTENELAAAGTATSYRADGGLPENGRWTFTPDGAGAYRTRVLVRQPTDPATFSGTVIVEWLNVSGGVDAGFVLADDRAALLTFAQPSLIPA
jgi:hypothetical protein